MAEDAARELPNLPLEDVLLLVHPYAEKQSPKYGKAALRWLERYLAEGSPRLQRVGQGRPRSPGPARDPGPPTEITIRGEGYRSRGTPGDYDCGR
jgi:hypothetical protein